MFKEVLSLMEKNSSEEDIRKLYIDIKLKSINDSLKNNVILKYKQKYRKVLSSKHYTYDKILSILDGKTIYDIGDEFFEDIDGKRVPTDLYYIVDNEGIIIPSLELYIKENYIEKKESDIKMDKYIVEIKPYINKLINREFDLAMDKILSKYPESEQKTWDKQERQAYSVLDDDGKETILLDKIAETRGIDVVDLANKIIYKAQLLEGITGIAIGYRQRAESMVETITDIDSLNLVINALENDKDVFDNLIQD